MYTGKLVFTQIMEHLPQHTFRRCVKRYDGDRHVKKFTCQDQFRSMAFAQLTYRESLRDIDVCLKAQQNKLYHMGIRSRVARSTLAEANEKRDWRTYADFAQSLIQTARRLYIGEDLGLDLDNTVYALDATTIDLCLTVFPWAHYRNRWQVELFFKWIKQHLRIKSFFGTSENAVKTHVWIAVSVYVIVAIIKKRHNIKSSLYSILQILSLTIFETMTLDQLLTGFDQNMEIDNDDIQLNLFNNYSGH